MNQRLLPRELEGHDPTLALLPPEQQLRSFHRLALPTVHRLRRQHWFLFTPAFVFALVLLGQWVRIQPFTLGVFCCLVAYLVGELLLTQRDRWRWRRLKYLVGSQAAAIRHTEGVAPLLDFAQWLTQAPLADEAVFEAVREALERLLPRLDTLGARQLSESQRAFLRRCVENQDPTVEFVVAALLVLGSAGDQQVIPIARTLACSSSSQRIRDAAILCLEELGQP